MDPDVHGISNHPDKADKEIQFLRAPADPCSPGNSLEASPAVHLCRVLSTESTADIMPCYWLHMGQLYGPVRNKGNSKLQEPQLEGAAMAEGRGRS